MTVSKHQTALKLHLESYPETVCLRILLFGLEPFETSVILD